MDKLGMSESKWLVFEKAIDLFCEYGYENVSMRTLAKELNMQAASIYSHFESKDELLKCMFQFYATNYDSLEPDLNEIIQDIEKRDIYETLMGIPIYYPADLQPLMDRIFIVAAMQSRRDEKAMEMIRRRPFGEIKQYFPKVLRVMVEKGMIYPLDIDGFVSVFSNYAFSAALRNETDSRLSKEEWLNGLQLLFSVVRKKPRKNEQI